MDEFYTLPQMAKILGITTKTLRNRISERKNHPPFFGRGEGIRFPKDEFKNWQRTHTVREIRSAS